MTKLIVGVNDLCSQYPQVAVEFYLTKNEEINVTKLFIKSK